MKKTTASANPSRRARKTGQRPAPAAAASTPARTPPGESATARFAGQVDQSPPASLERCWDNLHPARIWPD